MALFFESSDSSRLNLRCYRNNGIWEKVYIEWYRVKMTI